MTVFRVLRVFFILASADTPLMIVHRRATLSTRSDGADRRMYLLKIRLRTEKRGLWVIVAQSQVQKFSMGVSCPVSPYETLYRRSQDIEDLITLFPQGYQPNLDAFPRPHQFRRDPLFVVIDLHSHMTTIHSIPVRSLKAVITSQEDDLVRLLMTDVRPVLGGRMMDIVPHAEHVSVLGDLILSVE